MKNFTEQHRKNLSIALRGNSNGRFRVGFEHSEETKKRISEVQIGRVPWNLGKGTKSSKNELTRKCKQARLWRKAVFERDDYTCQECGQRGGDLHAHHIKPFAYFPELRFAIDNGATLCVKCHKQTDTFGKKADKFKK